MKKWVVAVSAAMSMLLAFNVMASVKTLKIGVVDVQEIVAKAPQVKTINDRLSTKFKSRQEKVVALQNTLKKDMEKMERDAAVLSAKDKSALEEKILSQQRDLQRLGQDYQQDLSREQNKEMQEFFTKVKDAIDKVAKKESYDIILQKDGVPYASDSIDITKQVLDALS